MQSVIFSSLLIPILGFSIPSLEWMAKHLPEAPVIVEAGAHIGTDTLRMSQQWAGGIIYAFEPDPRVYLSLEKKAASSHNIAAFPIALGNQTGFADFYLSKSIDPGYTSDYAQSSLLPSSKEYWQWNYIGFDDPIQVPITTLDAWAKEHEVDHVDFLWLDMQGSEFQMLEASPEILKTVKVIQTEFSKLPFYQGTVLFDDLTGWLEERGFQKVYEDPETHGNAVFLRPNS